jgi:F0F1-type ATP synthase membrane subunit c/vacuolar-type H+-ATPase subunit K
MVANDHRSGSSEEADMAGNFKRMATALTAAGGAAGVALVIGLSGASPVQAYPLPPTPTTTTTIPVIILPPVPLPTPAPLPPVGTIPATGGTSLTEGVMIGSTLAVAGFGLVIVSHRRRGDSSLNEGT